jgi:hypothetical protein
LLKITVKVNYNLYMFRKVFVLSLLFVALRHCLWSLITVACLSLYFVLLLFSPYAYVCRLLCLQSLSPYVSCCLRPSDQ